MRATRGFVVALLLASQMFFTSSVWATHAVPVNTTFTASGAITIATQGVDIPCNATLVLTTDAAGNVRITQMTFNALASPLCTTFEAQRLPWPVGLTGSFGIAQTAYLQSPLGSCIGALAMTFWASTATLSGNWGICPVSGSLTISPSLTIITP